MVFSELRRGHPTGKDAWLVIATELADGHTISEAVQAANDKMQNKFYQERWTFLGDGNARIKK